MSTNDVIYDALTRHQVFLQRYAKGREREAASFVRSVLEESILKLDMDLTDIPISVMDRVTQDLMEIGTSRYGTYSQSFVEEMVDFVDYEVDFNYRLLRDNVSANIIRPNTNEAVTTTLSKIMNLAPRKGYTIRDSLRSFGIRKSYQVAQIVRDGYMFGEETDTVTQRIMDLTGTQQRQASTLARTITNHVAINARNMVIRQNGGVIQGYKWISILDAHTSLICASRDGTFYEDKDENPKPPAHFNCRSTIAFLVNDQYDLGKDYIGRRPAQGPRGGKTVRESTNYEKWLRRQPVAFQEDVLGKAKATLFRRGKLSIDRFVDDSGKVLSLQELKELEPLAFERVGL
jgi:SPP1 gp7 family putative phage head morphogenesis protein